MPFQHTAARRRLGNDSINNSTKIQVSTHSRPKAAGRALSCNPYQTSRFNTQPPEGGWLKTSCTIRHWFTFQHTAARRRLAALSRWCRRRNWFQHTAARRRLGLVHACPCCLSHVSTHSRPKAAGICIIEPIRPDLSFNTQPPEGGWSRHSTRQPASSCFNTQPPEGGWK